MTHTPRLAISVEQHPEEFADALESVPLVYRVLRSSRRWLYLTERLPEPAAEATARFLEQTILPEMLLEHIDADYDDLPDEDRLELFQENSPIFGAPAFHRGTVALVQPVLEERDTFSVEGWLRFRGRRLLLDLLRSLVREGLKGIRLRRAMSQFRTLHLPDHPHLILRGGGDSCTILSPSGTEPFHELLDGYLDPSLPIDREEIALYILQTLSPARLDLEQVPDALRQRLLARGLIRPQA